MQKIHCPICSAVVDAEDYKETYISPYNNQEYKRYECPNCDVHWWEPLKIIPEFYESEVFEAYATFHEGVRKLPDWCVPFFDYFPKNVRGRMLDVGCGDGVFLKHAKELGFEVWGIDFDKKSVEVAKNLVGVDTIFAMSLEEFYEYAKAKHLKFDVITFFEVLEHQDKPREFLEIVKELLKEGGYIAGSVPNRERLLAKDADWKYLDFDFPPHHFLRFSDSSLRKALAMLGFSNVLVFKPNYPFSLLFTRVWRKLVGNLDRDLKVKFKSYFLKDEKLAKVVGVDNLDYLLQARRSFFKLILLKLLIYFRNLLLIPYIQNKRKRSEFVFPSYKRMKCSKIERF